MASFIRQAQLPTVRAQRAEQNEPVVTSDVREGTFSGGLPYLAVGSGEPLVYMCGSTPNHRNPRPGLERALTLRTINPLARAGFEVYFAGLGWPWTSPLPRLPSAMPMRFMITSASRWMCSGPAPADLLHSSSSRTSQMRA
jgi:hypothetical protein